MVEAAGAAEPLAGTAAAPVAVAEESPAVALTDAGAGTAAAPFSVDAAGVAAEPVEEAACWAAALDASAADVALDSPLTEWAAVLPPADCSIGEMTFVAACMVSLCEERCLAVAA